MFEEMFMRNRVWIALALASAFGLAGCGGGGGNPTPPSLASVSSVNAASKAPSSAPSGGFKAVVSFGDSLSDVGTYTLAAYSTYANPASPLYNSSIPAWAPPAAYAGGGQFTVNGLATGNWVSDLATSLGLPITPNVIGYAGQYFNPRNPTTPSKTPIYCPFTVQANCYGFAQGGSMISTAAGIGNSTGALTYPLTQQVQNYLTQFGAFNSNQLITVLAGNNDIFTALSNVSTQVTAAVTQAATQAAQAGTPLTADQLATLKSQATTQAAAVAQATVADAADQLAGQVQLMLKNNAKYVLVYTLPDSSLTPFGQSLSGGTTCDNTDIHTPCYLLSNLVQVFNQRLLNDLQGQPVKMMDGFALLNKEIASPAQFGFTNVVAPVCDINGPVLSKLGNSSLFCNTSTLVSGLDPNTSLFADAVHPTPAGYQIIANTTLQAMQGFGWISQ